MVVLIGFVTPNDPISPRGPGQILTATRALAPRYVHLLYTDTTKGQMEATKAMILEERSNVEVESHYFNVPDAREYSALVAVLPGLLQEIRRKRRGLFHLVSGHPQVRLVMALCLVGRVLDGVLHDVGDPDPKTATAEGPEDYRRRLRTVDLEIFDRFREMAVLSATSPRLRLNLAGRHASVDGKSLDLRARRSTRGGEARPLSFNLLVLLAVKSRYGATPGVPKALVERVVYRDVGEESRRTAIPRAIRSLNRQAARLTRRSPIPLDPLVCEQEAGVYVLSEGLRPPEEKIAIEGDVWEYLVESLGYTPTPEEFPFLRLRPPVV